MGEPCIEGLTAVGGKCQAGTTDDVNDQGGKVEDANTNGNQKKPECGKNGTRPCPGQPACGKNLFLIKDRGEVICSVQQPSVYPSHL